MAYRFLADLVVGVHALFVAFVVVGGLPALRWPWMAALHLPAAAWGALIELRGWICPLTPLENSLRQAAGECREVRAQPHQRAEYTLTPRGPVPRIHQCLRGNFDSYRSPSWAVPSTAAATTRKRWWGRS